MFVSDEATLDVGFDVALARLAALTRNGALKQVSADAYAAGAPVDGPWRSLSCFGDLITRPDRAVLAVRWETGGRAGEPFPVLDADLTLTSAGPCGALLQLAGVYRIHSDEAGQRVATVTIGGFLSRIAETITAAAAG
jgi:hypothetical protein